MNLAAVDELDIEVRRAVCADHVLRYPLPTRWLSITVHEHIPRRGLELGASFAGDDCVGAWVFDQPQEELHTRGSRLTVTPPTTETSVLRLQPMELLLLRVRQVREVYVGSGCGHGVVS